MFSRSKNYLSSETTPISWDIHGQSRLRLILDGTTPPSKMHWPNKHVKQMSNSRACITHARIWKRRNHETWLRPCVEIGFNSKLLHVLPRKCCTSLFRSSPRSVGTFSSSFFQENSTPSLANRFESSESTRWRKLERSSNHRTPSIYSLLTT